MSLRQQIEQLIASWYGMDAHDRSAAQAQLVRDLMTLVQSAAPESVDPSRKPKSSRTAA